MLGLAKWHISFTEYDDSIYLVKEPVDVLCLIKLPYKIVINKYKNILTEDIKFGFGMSEIAVDYIREGTKDYYECISQYFEEYINLDEKSKFRWNPKKVYTIYLQINLETIGKWKSKLDIIFYVYPFRINIKTNPFNPLKRKLKDVNIKETTFEYISENEVFNLKCFRMMGDLAKFKSIKSFLEYIIDNSIGTELEKVKHEIEIKEKKIKTIESETSYVISFLKSRAEELNKLFTRAKNEIERLYISKRIY